MNQPDAPRAPAVYFDGTSSARNDVVVEAGATGLRIMAGRGQHRLLDEWAYAELRRMSAPDGVLRLARRGETLLARLEIRDAELAAAIEDRADALDRGGAAERRLRRKVVGLSFAAAASLIVTAVFGLPALAGRIIPFIPLAVERKLGDAVDKNIRAALDTQPSRPGVLLRRRCGRNRRTRGARQARRSARSGRRVAVAAPRRGGAPRRTQCRGAARRPHLCR